jgi:hypothetical protein
MSAVRIFGISIAAASMFYIVGCSQSSAPTPEPKSSAPAQKQRSNAELLKLYDSSSLIEAKTLSALPPDLQSALGVHATGYSRLADVGEPCDPTDVITEDPGRCFLVGGASGTSALVAFRTGGYVGPLGVGEAYVHTNSTWTKVAAWNIGFPTNLNALREMTSFPPDRN